VTFSDSDSEGEEEVAAEEEKQATTATTTTTAIRAAAFALVLGPPLAASLANPGSFFGVLNAVGGYGMTALYGVLPPLMAWKLREKQQEKEKEVLAGKETTTKASLTPEFSSSSSSSMLRLLPGGRAALTALTTASIAVEIARLADDLEGWKRAAEATTGSDGTASAFAEHAASSSSFTAVSTAFQGFVNGGDVDANEVAASVVSHVSELLAAILP